MLHIFRHSCSQAGQVKPPFALAYGLLVVLLLLGGHAHAQSRVLVDKTAQQFPASLPQVTNGSVAWGDYNNDGRQDLLMIGDPHGGANSDYVLSLYQNTPNGFVDVSNLIPRIMPTSLFKGIRNGAVAWADYDNDGGLDFMLTGQTPIGYGVSILFQNSLKNGAGFIAHTTQNTRDKTLPENLPQVDFSTVNWVDYDSDGWLDLMITGSQGIGQGGRPLAVSRLYHNVKGQYRFDDVTNLLPNLPGVAYGAVAWGDYDNDKKPDLLLTGQSSSGLVGKLYHNTGSGFEDVTSSRFPNLPGVQNGAVAWGDYDKDGKLDLVITGQSGSGNISKLYRNTGSGFDDVSTQLSNLPPLANGTANWVDWVDFEKKGHLDLLLTGDTGSGYTTKLYHNTGSGFIDDSLFPDQLKLNLPQVALSAVAWADYDNDGFPDLLLTGKQEYGGPVSQLFHNQPLGAGATDSTRFRLVAPLYNCQSGAFTFQTTGGDGSPIEFMAPGITVWTSDAHQFVDRDTRTAADAQPITLVARQSGQEVRYVFDIRALCPVGDPNQFRLVAPLYDCQSGAFRFQTTGGNGSPIEYMAPGITAWTSNPQQYVDAGLRQAADAQPLILWARQGGNEMRYIWDLRAICPLGSGLIGLPGQNLNLSFEDQSSLIHNLPDVNDAALSWVDYDNDGRLDLMLTGDGNANYSRLYHNTGSGFEDVSSLIPDLPQVTNGALAWGDYNNDGRVDLLLTGLINTSTYVSKLYKNTSSGFVDVSSLISDLPQVSAGSAAWGDYDNDGKLDLMLAGSTGRAGVSKLYHNTGSGFEDQSSRLPNLPQLLFSALAWGDYDNDGRLDLMLTGLAGTTPTSVLYHNTGTGFEVDSDQLPNLVGLGAGSVAWNDFDNDGRLDLLLTGTIGGDHYATRLYRNTTYGFEDASHFPGLYLSAVAFGDYDNDGLKDLMFTGVTSTGFTSKLYRNTSQGFIDASNQVPTLPQLGYSAVAWGDYDNDGKLDLLLTGDSNSGVMSKLYHNISPAANTPPTPPSEFISRPSTSTVQLVWDLGTDAQTAKAGLNYNVYVSDTPGGVNTLSPMANLSTGYRRVVGLGDSQTPTITLTGLAPGKTYYWSVQAIDGAFAGSVFAPEQSFTTSSLLGDTDSTRFRLIAPLYNCQSGAFTFQTTGGDGSPIEYMAPGITVWTSDAHQFVDRDTRTAADAQPITLVARQSGQEVRYVFDIRALCPVGDPNQFRLVAPLYDCQSGAFRFQTTGGNGSPIEYMAPGITAWTSNPQQYVDAGLRQAADAQPLILWARQGGNEVRYIWDLRAICPLDLVGGKCSCYCCVGSSARVGAGGEPGIGLKAQVYPNPVVGQQVTVVLEGVQGQSVRLVVVDLMGHSVVDQPVAVEQPRQEHHLDLGFAPGGMYLLRVSTARESQTLKLIKTP